MLFLVGSFTAPVVLWRLLGNGEFEFVKVVPPDETAHGQSWMEFSSCMRFLYSTDENANTISSFKCVTDDGLLDLKLLNSVNSEGLSPCFLELNDKIIFVANYKDGKISSLRINEDGSVGSAIEVIDDNNLMRREGETEAHAHCILIGLKNHPHNLYVCDLGFDSVYSYKLSFDGLQSRDVPKLHLQDTLLLPVGSGPRHIVFHPNGLFAYVVNEVSSSVCVVRVNQESHTLANDIVETQSTLRKEPISSPGSMGAAEILLSKNNRFLYISNRCIEDPTDAPDNLIRNTIAVFELLEDGSKLQKLQDAFTQGIHPRHMCLCKDDTMLIVANMISNNLVTFNVDIETGIINELSAVITDTSVYSVQPCFVMKV